MPTSISDSKNGTSPAPVSGRVSPDIQEQVAAAKAAWKALQRQANAEAVANRIAKRNAAKAAKAADIEAFACRVYKVLWSAKERGNLAFVKSVLEEFLTDSIDQRYTLAAMKARREAAILAEGGQAGSEDSE